MRRRTVIISTTVFALVLGIVILCTPAISVLSISSRKNKVQRLYHSTKGLNDFVISYTHSVNKGRVHDFYTWDKSGTLTMEQTEFVSYGAGIPEPGETPGADFVVTYDGYFIKNINRNVEKLVMAVGIIANHTIRFDSINGEGDEIPFKAYFEPQTSLILEIKKVPVLEYLLHKF